MWMSMRSMSGPEDFRDVALDHWSVQWHSRVRSLRKPHGQGFMAAAQHESVRGMLAPSRRGAIVTDPSSSGWRSTSRTLRGNSGSSSRNSKPLWESETSPGAGLRLRHQSGIGDGVGVASDTDACPRAAASVKNSGYAVNLCRLKRFFECQRWQDRRHAAWPASSCRTRADRSLICCDLLRRKFRWRA